MAWRAGGTRGVVLGVAGPRCVCISSPRAGMRSALALVLGLATVGSLALNVQPHRTQLARRVRLSRPGLAGPRMQNEEEIAELEARLAGLKKAKVRCVRVQGRSRASTRQLGAHAECMRTCGCVGVRVCESQGALVTRVHACTLRVAGGGGRS